MTDNDARRLKADALLVLAEAKQRLSLVREIANKLGQELAGLGSQLQNTPDNISVETCTELLSQKRLSEIVADVKQAISDLQTADAKALELGCPLTN